MKAMICRQWGGPEDLRLEDVEPAALKPGQARIRIKAAGVSFATTLVIAGKYQRRPPFPFAPGTEVSGVVTEVAPGCKRLKAGDEVVAVLDWGGLAEETVAHEVNVFLKPRNVGFVEAIQLPISYPTSAGALTWPTVLDVQKGQTLLVHAAAGGVGMAAVEIGKILGATVIATAGGARKTAFARVAAADIEMRGKTIREGQRVFAFMNSANRDPDAFDDPERFDIARPQSAHMTFGYGIHFCLGAPLARLESRIAAVRLAERLPGIRLTGGDPEWHDSLILRGVKSLPVQP